MDAETQLVLDTLYDSRRGSGHSCFVTNQAGLLLLQCPASVLPVIEKVLREVVDPVLSGSETDSSKDAALENLLGDYSSLAAKSTFPGLDYLLGAYLVIGARSDFDRAKRFLLTVSDALLAKAVSEIPTFFNRMDDGYNFGVSPEGKVKDFLLDLSRSDREGVGSAAAHTIEQMAASHFQ